MNNWIIELAEGKQENVQCDVVGVAQDGSLLCFITENNQPTALKGYAPGEWRKFYRSSIRAH